MAERANLWWRKRQNLYVGFPHACFALSYKTARGFPTDWCRCAASVLRGDRRITGQQRQQAVQSDACDQARWHAPQRFFPYADASQGAARGLLLAAGQADFLGPPGGCAGYPRVVPSRDLEPRAIQGSGEHQPCMHAATNVRERSVVGHRRPQDLGHYHRVLPVDTVCSGGVLIGQAIAQMIHLEPEMNARRDTHAALIHERKVPECVARKSLLLG